MLFDTHAHLSESVFDADRDQLIDSFKNAGIGNVIDVGEDVAYSKLAVNLAERYDMIYAAVGAHPYSAKEMTDEDIETLKNLAASPKVLAIGEIGLDYHKDNHIYKDKQKYWFERQIELAQELGLPIIVHDRDAHDDCLSILREAGVNRGVIHCFSGDADFAAEVCNIGMYCAFGGSLTYKNAQELVDAARAVPIDRILIETDCPYLAPQGFRGMRNDPRYVRYVVEKIAEIRNIAYDEIAEITYNNAWTLFRR
ncbi:MAG: TatD family hydrolase [Clostridiales bacterium]|jgi:TatD DNase family protein|nr:TatD family hydrolase [Clostridiales bacterium]